jgi:hypothetical protein
MSTLQERRSTEGEAASSAIAAPTQRRGSGLALFVFSALALVLWGPWVLDAPGSTIVAANDIDPSAYLWFFSWWPYALLHGLNPFYTDLIFVPDGYNLAWVTSMPGPSVLLAPVTLALGPAVTWNLVSLASPALSSWTAFLLCRHVSGSFLPSLLGGYLFGFSPYMFNQLRGAPQLALVALVPLLVLLVLRHLQGSLSDRRFAVAVTAVLTGQILISTEVFATATVFGSITLAAGYVLFAERREALRRTVLLLGVGVAATAVLVSPLLYYVFFGERTLPEQALARYPADLLSFVVPGPLLAAGPERLGGTVPSWATGAAYAGLPLLALVTAFAWVHRRRRAALLAVGAFLVVAIAALGGTLYVGGASTGIPLPWTVVDDLPLLRYAIPLRFPAFAFLAAGMVVTLWLTWRPSAARWALAILAVACLAPAVGNAAWNTSLVDVPFFADEGHERYLDEDDRVLTVPAWGRNMYWQVQADFSFGLAAGYAGAFPQSYTRYAAWRKLFGTPVVRVDATSPAELHRFLADKGVTAIVVERGQSRVWRRLFGGLGVPPVETEGVLLYRLVAASAG